MNGSTAKRGTKRQRTDEDEIDDSGDEVLEYISSTERAYPEPSSTDVYETRGNEAVKNVQDVISDLRREVKDKDDEIKKLKSERTVENLIAGQYRRLLEKYNADIKERNERLREKDVKYAKLRGLAKGKDAEIKKLEKEAGDQKLDAQLYAGQYTLFRDKYAKLVDAAKEVLGSNVTEIGEKLKGLEEAVQGL